MAVTRARKLAIQNRRHQVSELYLQGWNQCAIAEKLQVAQATICGDLRMLQVEWRESRLQNMDAARELEIQKLDRLEREAWAAWERSQKPSQSAEFGDDTSHTPKKKRVKNQNGDPRFLVVVHQCIASRRQLMGLDALPALPKDTNDAGANSTERVDRIVGLITAIRDRERTETPGTVIESEQSRSLRSDGERGALEDGAAPGLPGPSDH